MNSRKKKTPTPLPTYIHALLYFRKHKKASPVKEVSNNVKAWKKSPCWFFLLQGIILPLKLQLLLWGGGERVEPPAGNRMLPPKADDAFKKNVFFSSQDHKEKKFTSLHPLKS